MKHVSFRYLVWYVEGNLDRAQREKVEAHVALCADCRRELERMRHLKDGVGEFVAPPADLVSRVMTAVRRRKARRAERPRYWPALRFDSWTRWAALGMRGTPQERLLLFSEDTFDFDVQIAKGGTAGTFVLRGQVLGKESPPGALEGIELHVVNADGVTRRGLTDEVGCFSFTQLPEGTYSVHVIFDDRDIVLDPVVIGDSRSD